jgi:hypothetical protein
MTPALKVPITVRAYFVLSWFIGWWLVYDGLHQRVFGDYVRIDGQLGPWADLVSAVGLDPLSLSWFFIVLGSAFLATSFGLYYRQRWAHTIGLAASGMGLLHLGFGLPVAFLCLVMLLLKPTRAYVASE